MIGFERTWTVRFSDTDPFGIAHYPRIVDAIHDTSDMLVDEAGYPFWEMADEGFGLPLVAMDFEFDAPVEAGDDVTITATVELGSRSVEFLYEARSGGERVFHGSETRVCAHAGGSGSMPIPDGLRDALEVYADE